MTTVEASLRPDSDRDRDDCLTLLGRLVRLDAGPVRLQTTAAGMTLWARPQGVLVSREIRGRLSVPDRTVDATELREVLAAGGTTLPPAQDGAWSTTLPPQDGWRRLDRVPVDALRAVADQATRLVRAAPDPATAGGSLLQQEVLSVSDDRDTVTLDVRTVVVLQRLGMLPTGADPDAPAGDVVTVAVTSAWTRVAARHGTAYRRRGASLGLR